MPFTFSHPLYSVPLHRAAPRWLSITGLLLGSMAPDFEYFMAMESYRSIGHSLLGFILMELPLCIGIAIAFHLVVKPVLPKFIPSVGGLDQYAASLSRSRWELRSVRAWITLLISLFIGFLTHLFMDSWTHRYGSFVEMFPFLKERIAGEGWYQWLQYGFSALGVIIPACILLRHYLKWRSVSDTKSLRPTAPVYTKIILWVCVIMNGGLLFLLKLLFSYHRLWVGIYIVAPMTSLLFGLFTASMLYQALQYRKKLAGISSLFLYGGVMLLFKILELTAYWQDRKLGLWIAYMMVWSLILIYTSWIVTRNGRITLHNTSSSRLKNNE